MTCARCGADVPEGRYCAQCGHIQDDAGDRLHRYALHPDEHVVSPHLLSTLLPHLPAHRLHVARWLLLGGAAVVAILAATGLVSVATIVAAVLVPVTYVMYMRSVDHFAGDAPVVLFGTVVAGGVLGALVTLVAGAVGSNLSGGGVIALDTWTAVVMVGVSPLIALVLLRPRHPETVDGLVLGVAAGAGFAIAQTLVNLAGVISGAGLRTDPASWVLTLLSAAVLIPLLAGSCSGLVAASLWRRAGGHSAALRLAGLPLALIAAVSFTAGSELLDDAALNPVYVVLWQAVVVAGVVVATRILLHATLLDEEQDLGLHEGVCAHCDHATTLGAFCPRCGAAQVSRGTAVVA